MKLLRIIFGLFIISLVYFFPSTGLAADFYRVKPYLVVPSAYELSTAKQNRYSAGIRSALFEVQRFYASKLNGKTFNIDDRVEIIKSSKSLQGIHSNLYTALIRLAPELDVPQAGLVRAIFILGTDTTFNYTHGGTSRPAWGAPRGLDAGITYMDHLVVDSLAGGDSQTKLWNVYALAHELGHAFGLNQSGYALWHTCWTQYQDQECIESAPLPLPEGDESANSVMSYNNTYGTLGITHSQLAGFVNTIHNPEIKKLYQSPFINPNHDPAPEPPQPVFRAVDFNPEANGLRLEGVVLSNNDGFTKENINGAQGSKSVYLRNDGQARVIDWVPNPLSSPPGLYIKEVYSDKSVKIRTVDLAAGEQVDVNDWIKVNIKGERKIISKIFLNEREFNLQSLLDRPAWVDLQQNRLVRVSVNYSDNTSKNFVLDFTASGDKSQACLENRYFCSMKESGKLVRIHHGNGRWNGSECVYADVESGNCEVANSNPARLTEECFKGSYTLGFEPIEHAQRYLIRVDRDPDSWSAGNYNGDVVDNSPQLINEGGGYLRYRRTDAEEGRSYGWWFHPIHQNGASGDPIQGQRFTCRSEDTGNCEAGLCPVFFLETRSQNGQLFISWEDLYFNRKADHYAIRLDKDPDSFDPARLESDEVLNNNHRDRLFQWSCQAGRRYRFWVHPVTADGRFGNPDEVTLTCQGQVTQCSYSETCGDGDRDRRSCTGTIQEGICKYDPAVAPNCTQCALTGGPTPGPTPGVSLQRCQYAESCNNTGARTCTGALEGGVCKYNPAVSPACGSCSVGSGPAEGSGCNYPENCTKDDGGGGIRSCQGTIQGGSCRYAGGAAEDICTVCQ